MCSSCSVGKVKPYYFSTDQAVSICDNLDCDSFLDKWPWELVFTKPLPVSENSCKYEQRAVSRSSGINSDYDGGPISPSASQSSVTDKEVELLLSQSYSHYNGISGKPLQTKSPCLITQKAFHSSSNLHVSTSREWATPSGTSKNNVPDILDSLDDLTFDKLIALPPEHTRPDSFHEGSNQRCQDSWPHKIVSPCPVNLTLCSIKPEGGVPQQQISSPSISPLKTYIPSYQSAFFEVSPSKLNTSLKSSLDSSKVMRELCLDPCISNKGNKDISISDSNFLSPASSGISEDSGFTDEENCIKNSKLLSSDDVCTNFWDNKNPNVNILSSHFKNKPKTKYENNKLNNLKNSLSSSPLLNILELNIFENVNNAQSDEVNTNPFTNFTTSISKESQHISKDTSSDVPSPSFSTIYNNEALISSTSNIPSQEAQQSKILESFRSECVESSLSTKVQTCHNENIQQPRTSSVVSSKNGKSSQSSQSRNGFKGTDFDLHNELLSLLSQTSPQASQKTDPLNTFKSLTTFDNPLQDDSQTKKSSLEVQSNSDINLDATECPLSNDHKGTSSIKDDGFAIAKNSEPLEDSKDFKSNELSSICNLEDNKHNANFSLNSDSNCVSLNRGSHFNSNEVDAINSLLGLNTQNPQLIHHSNELKIQQSLHSETYNRLKDDGSGTISTKHVDQSTNFFESETNTILPLEDKQEFTAEVEKPLIFPIDEASAELYSSSTAGCHELDHLEEVQDSKPSSSLPIGVQETTPTTPLEEIVVSYVDQTGKTCIIPQNKKSTKYKKEYSCGLKITDYISQENKVQKRPEEIPKINALSRRSLTKFKNQLHKDLWSIPELFLDSLDIEVVLEQGNNSVPSNTQSNKEAAIGTSNDSSEDINMLVKESNGTANDSLSQMNAINDTTARSQSAPCPLDSLLQCCSSLPIEQESIKHRSSSVPLQPSTTCTNQQTTSTTPKSSQSKEKPKSNVFEPIKLIPEVAEIPYNTHDCSSFISPPKSDGWRYSVGFSAGRNIDDSNSYSTHNGKAINRTPIKNSFHFDLDENFFTSTKPDSPSNDDNLESSSKLAYSPTPSLSDSDSCDSFQSSYKHLFKAKTLLKTNSQTGPIKLQRNLRFNYSPGLKVYHRKIPLIDVPDDYEAALYGQSFGKVNKPRNMLTFPKINSGIIPPNLIKQEPCDDQPSSDYSKFNSPKCYPSFKSKPRSSPIDRITLPISMLDFSSTLNYGQLLSSAKAEGFGTLISELSSPISPSLFEDLEPTEASQLINSSHFLFSMEDGDSQDVPSNNECEGSPQLEENEPGNQDESELPGSPLPNDDSLPNNCSDAEPNEANDGQPNTDPSKNSPASAPSLENLQSSLSQSSEGDQIVAALRESGWILAPCSQDINYSPPLNSKSPTIIPLALKDHYSDIASDVILWRTKEIQAVNEFPPEATLETSSEKVVPIDKPKKKKNKSKKRKRIVGILPPKKLRKQDTDVKGSEMEDSVRDSAHLFDEDNKVKQENELLDVSIEIKEEAIEPLMESSFEEFVDTQTGQNKDIEDSSVPEAMALKDNDVPIEDDNCSNSESDEEGVIELPDEFSAYDQIRKEGLFTHLKPPQRPVTPPLLPFILTQNGVTVTGTSKRKLKRAREEKEARMRKKKKMLRKKRMKKKKTSQEQLQQRAEDTLQQVVAKPDGEIPSMICMCFGGKTYVYHRDQS